MNMNRIITPEISVPSRSASFFARHRSAVMIFLLAFLVRIAFVFPDLISPEFSPAPFAQDGYYEIAENLLHGNGYSRSKEAPYKIDDVRTPIYPLFITIIVFLTGSYKALFIIQAFIGSFIPLFGRRMASRVFKNENIALAVGLFLALEPHSIWLSSMIFSETLFAFFFLASCVCFLAYIQNGKMTAIALASFLTAIAMLVRPTIQYLPFFFALLIAWRHKDDSALASKHILVMCAVIFVILMPWLFRNYTVFGSSVLTMQSDLVLYANYVPTIIALEEGISFDDGRRKFWRILGTNSVEEMKIGATEQYRELILQEIPKHPEGILKSSWVSFYTFFTHDGLRSVLAHHGLFPEDEIGNLKKAEVLRKPWLIFSSPALFAIAAARAVWLLIFLFACAGLYFFIREKRRNGSTAIFGVFIAGVVAYFFAVSMVAGLGIDARFRNPANAFIVMFAAYGASMVSLFQSRNEPQIIVEN